MMKRVVKKISDTTEYNVPLMLSQDYNNVGLYTPTNGEIGQIDVICNFVVETNVNNHQNIIKIKDGVDIQKFKFIKGLEYTIQWGDGNTDTYQVNGLEHTHVYASLGEYELAMTMETPWGRHKNTKKIVLPSVETVTFPVGIVTPESLGYDNEMIAYVNNAGVIICENAQSRLNEVTRYGQSTPTAYITDVQGMSGINGISQVTNTVTTYYIDRIKYMDDNQTKMTTISLYPSNFTNGDVVDGIEYINEMLNVYDGPVIHQEVFNGVTGDIDIQSDIFIDRGKQAPFEFYYKLGEVSNMKELEQNGNKFFTVNNSDDFKL